MEKRNVNSTSKYRNIRIHTKRTCYLEKLGKSYRVGTLQMFVLLRTANILRKVLSIKQKKLEKSKGTVGGGGKEKNMGG